jgi:hypothetical protein
MTLKIENFHIEIMSILKLEQNYLKNCAIQGYYAAHSGKFLPTFRENQSVPYSENQNHLLSEIILHITVYILMYTIYVM